MADDMQPWPSLRECLDAGGDPAIGWAGAWDELGDILLEIESSSSSERERRAARAESTVADVGAQPDAARWFEFLRLCAWTAELCRDGDLSHRVLSMRPEHDDHRFRPDAPYDDLFDADGKLITDFKDVDDLLREIRDRGEIPPE